MADKLCDIRYSERSDVGEISVENIIWFWGDRVEIFQNTSLGGYEHRSNMSFDKDSAIRYARMILSKYVADTT